MNSAFPSPEFEHDIRAAFAVPNIDPGFKEKVREQLKAAALKRTEQPKPIFHRPLRAVAVVAAAVLLAIVLIIGPERVWAQVLDWLKYVPGIGFVSDETGLRILVEPVSQTRDGITLTIEQGLVDDKRTWITYFFEDIPDELRPLSEDDPECFSYPLLLLPDGRILNIEAGTGGGGYTWTREQYAYPAIPSNVNEITAWLPCVPGVRRDEGPQNWEIKIHFVSAPEGYEMLPVIPLTTPTQEQAPEVTPETLHGVILSAENLVELENGYLIQGSVDWTQSEYSEVYFNEGMLSVTDANGYPIPVEPVYNDLSTQSDNRRIATWSLQTNRKDLASPLTVHLNDLITHYEFEPLAQTRFIFDFGDQPQDGQTWELNQVLPIGDYRVTVLGAQFTANSDGNYKLSLRLEVDRDQVASVGMRDLNNRGLMTYGGGGFVRDDAEYFVVFGYDYLPTGVHHFKVDALSHYLGGEWTTKVDLPESTMPATETLPENVCLTQASWQQLLAQPTGTLPVNLTNGLVLVENSVGALLPEQSLIRPDGAIIASLGQGSWAALSPDLSRVAYAFNGPRVFDVGTGQSRLLISEDAYYNMAWSPDGSRLAMIRGADGVYIINADGSDLHRAEGTSADMIGIAGWMPDGQNLVVARIATGGTQVQTLNVETGELKDNFLIDNLKGGFTHLSTDGTQIAFSSNVFGKVNYGIYVANLDGSNQRLIAEPGDEFMFTMGGWSTDGQWLILNPYQVTAFQPDPQHPVTINLSSCEAVVLDQVVGNVKDWR